MQNDTSRELFFSESPRAVGVMLASELQQDLIVSHLCVCPYATSPFRAKLISSGLESVRGCSLSDPLTLFQQCIDFGREG